MIDEIAITPEIIAQHGLRESEYQLILEKLEREPTLVELGLFSVMWSEHCAYKHSRPVLKTLPTEGPRVVVGPGENAGIIDAGDGLCIAFKMESHNHPSALEPYQGAATGVGGILRDIFTMGARPIAMLDNLRFGEPSDPHMQHLIEGVIEGIAGYGNCVGVPTVAGDISFEEGYQGNILVNVMCVGTVEKADVVKGQAHGPGNAVLYFGSPTGRDGIHGATFASEELNEDAVERRGAVQVGDPFMGKKILEATLELIGSGLVVGIQDMGAAGLTCSTLEMAGRAGTGMEVDLDLVPQRAKSMSAWEIMLSESQERMLAVCLPEKVEAALEVCRRWECDGVVIGRVTETGRLVVKHKDKVTADVPVLPLTEEAPVYYPPAEEAAPPAEAINPPALTIDRVNETLTNLLSSPTVASKRWAFGRYDYQVQTNTVVQPGQADAAVLRIRGEGKRPDKFIAVTGDCNSRIVARDPFVGGQYVVCEAARNLVCTGAEPVGLTNCLNFGSPEKPRVFHTFKRCIEGMGAACRALEIPVTGGNVSLYNETHGKAIPPTPMIGMVGLIESAEHITRSGFQNPGDAIFVLGQAAASLAGSEFAKLVGRGDAAGQELAGRLTGWSLEEEVRLQRALLGAIRGGLVSSAHDVSEGGLAVALAECCITSPNDCGAELDWTLEGDLALELFGEFPAQVVVSTAPENASDLESHCRDAGVAIERIGSVVKGLLNIGAGPITIDELRQAWSRKPY